MVVVLVLVLVFLSGDLEDGEELVLVFLGGALEEETGGDLAGAPQLVQNFPVSEVPHSVQNTMNILKFIRMLRFYPIKTRPCQFYSYLVYRNQLTTVQLN